MGTGPLLLNQLIKPMRPLFAGRSAALATHYVGQRTTLKAEIDDARVGLEN